jgi:hypothetical protein
MISRATYSVLDPFLEGCTCAGCVLQPSVPFLESSDDSVPASGGFHALPVVSLIFDRVYGHRGTSLKGTQGNLESETDRGHLWFVPMYVPQISN